jgi:IS30 family transposase
LYKKEKTMGEYRHVTLEDRIQIESYLKQGVSQSEIAIKLGFHKSTISKEISRNSGQKGYRYKQAQRLADERQECRSLPRKMNEKMISKVEILLKEKWSPEQISERMKLEGEESVSHETIYQHVYRDYKEGGRLYINLRLSHRRRKPRFPRKNKDRRGVIKNAISIEERPEGANNRSRIGHWERDLMLGADRSSAILLITDRKTREVCLVKLENKSAAETLKATIKALKGKKVSSITNDRGLEFSDHEDIQKTLNTKVYFCHPYTSSERGTCENRIGILRQFLPKGCSLQGVDDKELKVIQDNINSRPMKCLGWRTPYEVVHHTKIAVFN